MSEVGAAEAENTLSHLLDRGEAGEEVVIARRGKIVARLVPPRSAIDHDRARDAAAEIRKMSKGVRLDGLTIKALVTEGRT